MNKLWQYTKELFTYKERIGRLRYFVNSLYTCSVVTIVLTLLLLTIGILPLLIIMLLPSSMAIIIGNAYSMLACGCLALVILALLALNMLKRLHDLGVDGRMWLLLPLANIVCVLPQLYFQVDILWLFLPIRVANLIFGLFLLFWKGTDGPNKYGEKPTW
ncbi:MAG: DUF805 domain-containing protein [Candidatus Margulisiibacteriota bacterium]